MAKEKKNDKPKVSWRNRLRNNMNVHIVGGIVMMFSFFGFIVCLIGYLSFTNTYKREYENATFHLAETATLAVNGDHIDEYLADQELIEYEENEKKLDDLCHTLNVNLIYVIVVDTSDYANFVNVVEVVNNDVGGTNYIPWERKAEKTTTNEEYKTAYKNIYENGSKCETLFRMKPSNNQKPHVTTMVPIKDSNGTVQAVLCMQRPMSEINEALTPYIVSVVVGAVVMGSLISVGAVLFIKKFIIEPVLKISEETSRFAVEKTKNDSFDNISNYDQILKLVDTLKALESDVVNYIDNISKITKEKERIGAELSIAAQIQQDALPDKFPAYPDRTDFDIYASMDPAKLIGGDFYNFFFIDDDHLALVMADVSGKGVPAALFMMVTNIVIAQTVSSSKGPSEILRNVNEAMCNHNSSDMFVTVWLGILELSTGKLVSSNAGHEDPVIYRKDKDFEIIKEKHGFVIGGLNDIHYEEQTIILNKGDKLFLYTDGLPEATNASNKLFTINRMLDALNKHKEGTPQEIIEGVKKEVNKFVGAAPQFDDLTMLCIEMK